MSRATTTEPTVTTVGDDRGVEWLERNADVLDPTEHTETESADRARDGLEDAKVEPASNDGELYLVALPDGDEHLCLFVTHSDRSRNAAACSCEDYNHHGHCAHLLTLALRHLGDGPLVLAEDDDRAEALVESDGVDAEVIDHARDDDQDDEDVEGVEGDLEDDEPATPTPVDRDATDQPPESTDGDTTPATPSDPFAKELAEDVPERYVMELRGEPYIRRAGYAALARDAGLRVRLDAVEPASASGFEHARYKAVVLDDDGEMLATDVGTARLETEDLDGAEGELDELAATRAARRALEWATGAGNTL